MKLSLEVIDDAASRVTAAQAEYELAFAWHLWKVHSCEERGGHWWWLDVELDSCIYLSCLHCPASPHDLYPDGQDVLFGELRPGLVIEYGSLTRESDPGVAGWHGLVTAELTIERHPAGPWGPAEYDFWIDAVPA